MSSLLSSHSLSSLIHTTTLLTSYRHSPPLISHKSHGRGTGENTPNQERAGEEETKERHSIAELLSLNN